MSGSRPEVDVNRRVELPIGSPVHCLDGEAGRLERIIFSPRRSLVTHLVVHRGFIGHQDRVIPISHVIGNSDDAVKLDLPVAALQQSPVYDPTDYTTLTPKRHLAHGYGAEELIVSLGGASTDLQSRPAERSGVLEPRNEADQEIAVVSAGMEVVFRDPILHSPKKLGRVALVLLDPQTHHATHIVVRQGWSSALAVQRDIIVPLDWAIEITPARITLDAEPRQLQQLPEYRPDEEIAEDVRQALYDDPTFHEEADFFCISVLAREGVVELRGNVRNATRSRQAELIARRVAGVLDVRNELTPDDALKLQVERQLNHDERLEVQDLCVDALLGLIHLRGRVQTPEQRELAAQITRHITGVQAVNNVIQVGPGTGLSTRRAVEEHLPMHR